MPVPPDTSVPLESDIPGPSTHPQILNNDGAAQTELLEKFQQLGDEAAAEDHEDEDDDEDDNGGGGGLEEKKKKKKKKKGKAGKAVAKLKCVLFPLFLTYWDLVSCVESVADETGQSQVVMHHKNSWM